MVRVLDQRDGLVAVDHVQRLAFQRDGRAVGGVLAVDLDGAEVDPLAPCGTVVGSRLVGGLAYPLAAAVVDVVGDLRRPRRRSASVERSWSSSSQVIADRCGIRVMLPCASCAYVALNGPAAGSPGRLVAVSRLPASAAVICDGSV